MAAALSRPPSGTSTQRPRLVDAPQVLQVSWQALSQQKPSTQCPEAQSRAFRQELPSGRRGTQRPSSQWKAAAQPASFAQTVRQAPLGPHT
jgi:hypothetical protein